MHLDFETSMIQCIQFYMQNVTSNNCTKDFPSLYYKYLVSMNNIFFISPESKLILQINIFDAFI